MGKLVRTGGALLALALPALAPAREVEVSIRGMQFVPSRVELRRGDTVRWRNEDIVPHTATAAGKRGFESGSLAAGAEFRFTPAKTGTWKYVCRFHPTMKGELRVR